MSFLGFRPYRAANRPCRGRIDSSLVSVGCRWVGVQADRERLAVVADVERLGSLAELLARRSDRQEVLLEGELHAARPLRREERDAADRGLAGRRAERCATLSLPFPRIFS